ncbi:MAG TPA: hypothetical protein VM283_04710, partial [Armatimonadota bacterium]|nr:hypothetical protein [Armatimonadota bacterium]
MGNDDGRARDSIRELATRVAELAASDEYASRQRLWREVNSLRRPERPPVICHPGCWEELVPRSSLVSQDSFLSAVEYRLRQMLYKHEIGDDSVIEPGWPVPAAVHLEGEHLWGMPIEYTRTGVQGGAWAYQPPIRDEADIERIVPPRYRYDQAQTEENLSRMHDLLGDILTVRVTCAVPGPGAWLHGWGTQLCGVQPLLE